MFYVDGYLIPVPTAKREVYRQLAESMAALFKEHGALTVVECWGDDVPHGKLTDFYGAVQAKEDETVAFSWIEWPDKTTRDAMTARMSEIMESDKRFNPKANPPPFDGKRMIYAGFAPVVSLEK